jgi:hypothetical protein
MESIWKTIQQDVENKNWDTNGLQELFDKQLDVILTRELITFDSNRLYSTIKRNGDMVVGFYLDENMQTSRLLQLTIGGESLPNLEIQPGKFVYIFENTHVYPIISVVYSELHVTTDTCDGLYVVYGMIRESDLRRKMATNKQIIKLTSGKLACFRGCFGYLNLEKFPDESNELPNMRKEL